MTKESFDPKGDPVGDDRPGDRPVFLVGFMGTGKSTVGRALAVELGFAFTDLDDVITRDAGRSVAQIFSGEGEAGFRQREEAAVRAASAMRRTVIATGGGAACRETNLQAMLAAGRVIALSATPAEVIRRTGTGPGRPLLHGKADPEGVAAALLAEREPFYARAHHQIDTVGKAPADVVHEIVVHLSTLTLTAVEPSKGRKS